MKTSAVKFTPAPEAERCDPLPGSTGKKMPTAPSEDEDGFAGAELDKMRQASRTDL